MTQACHFSLHIPIGYFLPVISTSKGNFAPQQHLNTFFLTVENLKNLKSICNNGKKLKKKILPYECILHYRRPTHSYNYSIFPEKSWTKGSLTVIGCSAGLSDEFRSFEVMLNLPSYPLFSPNISWDEGTVAQPQSILWSA